VPARARRERVGRHAALRTALCNPLKRHLDLVRSLQPFSRIFRETDLRCSRAGGNIGWIVEIGFGSAARIAAIVLAVVFPTNARLAVTIS
jgi:hypothetical protein